MNKPLDTRRFRFLSAPAPASEIVSERRSPPERPECSGDCNVLIVCWHNVTTATEVEIRYNVQANEERTDDGLWRPTIALVSPNYFTTSNRNEIALNNVSSTGVLCRALLGLGTSRSVLSSGRSSGVPASAPPRRPSSVEPDHFRNGFYCDRIYTVRTSRQ
ncbi:hypothetical protein EVAR_23858_1 [Eumeta japonica]|uniref:Uncharacterized protein n=1 Tax=Eumeta variegata TaxID=151549 RepID=A0A4C1V5F1_EUMVA|nr:hypothetical protein EVAR_23858_1 [Eumeta japonica]